MDASDEGRESDRQRRASGTTWAASERGRPSASTLRCWAHSCAILTRVRTLLAIHRQLWRRAEPTRGSAVHSRTRPPRGSNCGPFSDHVSPAPPLSSAGMEIDGGGAQPALGPPLAEAEFDIEARGAGHVPRAGRAQGIAAAAPDRLACSPPPTTVCHCRCSSPPSLSHSRRPTPPTTLATPASTASSSPRTKARARRWSWRRSSWPPPR